MQLNWKKVGIVLTLALIILPTSAESISAEFESGAYWAVEVGDILKFRTQYLLCDRSLGHDAREYEFDEILQMEITSLGNLSLAYYGWIPTDYQSTCRNTLTFPNGSDVHFSEDPLVLGSHFPYCAAMPVGNWTGANEELYLAHLDVMDPYNHSYTLIEDEERWGYIYGVPEINMTDTRIWSKTDGSLLVLNITNGITERFVSTELAFDLLLERAQPSPPMNFLFIGGLVAGVAIVIWVIVFIRKHGS